MSQGLCTVFKIFYQKNYEKKISHRHSKDIKNILSKRRSICIHFPKASTYTKFDHTWEMHFACTHKIKTYFILIRLHESMSSDENNFKIVFSNFYVWKSIFQCFSWEYMFCITNYQSDQSSINITSTFNYKLKSIDTLLLRSRLP